MSTEHQRYSITHQTVTNVQYASERGYQVGRTYEDAGVSGLRFQTRPGLQRLLADILGGFADFHVVLVYDVSRWGRFQDPDESAHYEFLCRQAGVRVEYTAETFPNDGTLTSTIVKTMKRAMAAEYVRELSSKVRATKRGWGEQGYWTGGIAPYGYRRCLVDAQRRPMRVLERGERKALQGERVVLVAGPEQERETVRRVFSLFVAHGLGYLAIADLLNSEGVATGYDRPWSSTRIRKILGDEAYIGTLVMGHYGCFLKHQVVYPRERWRRVPGVIPALVSEGLFEAAQANLRRHKTRATDAELLDELRAAWARNGKLSENTLKKDPLAYAGAIYARRFGSLSNALERIGYVRSPEQQRMLEKLLHDRPHLQRTYHRAHTPEFLLQRLRELFACRGRLTSRIIDGTPGMPNSGTFREHFGSLSRAYELVGYDSSKHQRDRFRERHVRPMDLAAEPELPH